MSTRRVGPKRSTISSPAWTACSGCRGSVTVIMFGDRAGVALTGTRMGTALRGNDVLRQAILTLALRVGIDAS